MQPNTATPERQPREQKAPRAGTKLRTLAVGESLTWPYSRNSVSSCLRFHAGKTGWKFSQRKMPDGTTRVWRVR